MWFGSSGASPAKGLAVQLVPGAKGAGGWGLKRGAVGRHTVSLLPRRGSRTVLSTH